MRKASSEGTRTTQSYWMSLVRISRSPPGNTVEMNELKPISVTILMIQIPIDLPWFRFPLHSVSLLARRGQNTFIDSPLRILQN